MSNRGHIGHLTLAASLAFPLMMMIAAPTLAQAAGDANVPPAADTDSTPPSPRPNPMGTIPGRPIRPGLEQHFIRPILSYHNAKDEKDLGDGLRIVDLKAGNGPVIVPGSDIVMQFSTFTWDGDYLDTSRQPGRKPGAVVVPGGELWPAWDNAMMGMREGGRRQIWFPAKLGPGPKGLGPIPGGKDLAMDVDLLAVAPPVSRQDGRLEDDGRVWKDISVGTGPAFEKDGFAKVHITMWAADHSLIGSTTVADVPIETEGTAPRFWVPYAFGMKKGGARVIECNAPDAKDANGQPERWRVLIETLNVTPPVTMAKYNPQDLRDIGDGVKIVDIKVGDGDVYPGDEDYMPIIDYNWWSADGKLQDSTHKPGREKITYSAGLYPSVWQKCIKGMRKGGQRLMIVPAGVGGENDLKRPDVAQSFIYEITLDGWEEKMFKIDAGSLDLGSDSANQSTTEKNSTTPKPAAAPSDANHKHNDNGGH